MGINLQTALAVASKVRKEQVVGPSDVLTRKLAFRLKCPKGTEPAVVRSVFLRAVEKTYPVKIHIEKRKIPVIVLTKGSDWKLKMMAAEESLGTVNQDDGQISALGVAFMLVPNLIESKVGKKVFDETGIMGEFDFDIEWDPETPGSFVKAVRKQLGLELTETRRLLDVIVVERL